MHFPGGHKSHYLHLPGTKENREAAGAFYIEDRRFGYEIEIVEGERAGEISSVTYHDLWSTI